MHRHGSRHGVASESRQAKVREGMKNVDLARKGTSALHAGLGYTDPPVPLGFGGFGRRLLCTEQAYWMDLHFLCGYAVLTLLIFRIVWGFLGSQTARFGNF